MSRGTRTEERGAPHTWLLRCDRGHTCVRVYMCVCECGCELGLAAILSSPGVSSRCATTACSCHPKLRMETSFRETASRSVAEVPCEWQREGQRRQ